MNPENVLTVKKWILGILQTAISAAANTVVVMIVAPETFNIQEGLSKVGAVAGVSEAVTTAEMLMISDG
jgi:hypothetical protein